MNWLDDTSRSLAASFPSLGPRSSAYVTRRLSRLVLERLPTDVARMLIRLLPEERPDDRDLRVAADRQPDLSIAYPAFLEMAARSLEGRPATGKSLRNAATENEEYLEKVVDYFLWAFAQELPPELKHRIIEHLPIDLRNRMNLNSSHADESKVA